MIKMVLKTKLSAPVSPFVRINITVHLTVSYMTCDSHSNVFYKISAYQKWASFSKITVKKFPFKKPAILLIANSFNGNLEGFL